MIRNRDDLPDPLAPSTPIFAPGNIEMLIPRRTSRSGGWNRFRSRMVKMNCAGMASHATWGTPGEVRRSPWRFLFVPAGVVCSFLSVLLLVTGEGLAFV